MQVPLDVESIPQLPEEETKLIIGQTIQHPAQMKKQETIDAWHAGDGQYAGVKDKVIDETYHKTGLDGAKGQICSIACAIGLDAEPTSMFAIPGKATEADLISNFFDYLMAELKDRPAYFIGHFIGGFDLPFIYQRCVINGIKPPLDLNHRGRHWGDYFDTMVEWAGWKGTISQDNLCAALGIVIEGPEGLDGSKVWAFYQEGRYDEIGFYNRVDVMKVQAMYKRLKFIG